MRKRPLPDPPPLARQADQRVDSRVDVHDRRQFELKLEYQPSPKERRSRYAVDVFVCAPVSLNVAGDTVTSEQVYADIHNYVRFKTPELSWADLEQRTDAPLACVAAELALAERGRDPTRFGYQCKLFACVFRANLQELGEACRADVHDLSRVAALCEEGLAGMRATAGAYRQLGDRAGKLPPRAAAAFQLCDEYISLSVEQQLRKVIVVLDRARVGAELKDRLMGAILEEERYRQAQGWPSTIDPAGDNEGYVYRIGLLKKYCSSALFLQLRRFAAKKTMLEVFYAVAAGIAMAFATVVAFWAQLYYAALSIQLFLVLIVAYMFKDRMKEATRAAFARILARRFFDRKIIIFDPAGGELGTCQEKVEFLTEEQLPEGVKAIRRLHLEPSLRQAEIELSESVIHYRKEITLSSRNGLGITDIMRFHVGRFLHDMDEPEQEIEFMDLETRRLRPIRAAKVYHIDVVFRFAARAGAPEETAHMRLVLDRNGIKRLESFEGVTAAASP